MGRQRYGFNRTSKRVTPMPSSTITASKGQISRRSAVQASVLQIGLWLFLWISLQQVNAVPLERVDISITTADIPNNGYLVELSSEYKIFGEAIFSSVYINRVGTISFGGGIGSSDLKFGKHKAIVFAPLLLEPDVNATIEIQYTFSATEKETLAEKFREKIGVPDYVVESALTVCFMEDGGNEYTIYLTTDEEHTYVIYEYEKVVRIEDKHGYSQAGIFAIEDGLILCPHTLPRSGTAAIRNVQDFWARVDLPLKCEKLEISCTELPHGSDLQIAAKLEGIFFETKTVEDWLFYALYMCKPNFTKEDGSVLIRQTCADDPDYYDFSWTETTRADMCSVLRPPPVF